MNKSKAITALISVAVIGFVSTRLIPSSNVSDNAVALTAPVVTKETAPSGVSAATATKAAPSAVVPSTTRRFGSGDEESSESGSEAEGEDGLASTKPATAPAPAPAPATTQASSPMMTPPKTMMASLAYRNGVYSATGGYYSPGGYEQIGVTVTIKNDVITDTTATNMANDGRSQRYQDMFIANYQPYVVGKSVDSVQLGKVSGSSLTGSGFNDALSQIKNQAKA